MSSRITRFIKNKINYGLKGQQTISRPDQYLEKYIAEYGIINYFNFNYEVLKEITLSYIDSMRCGGLFEYKYAESTRYPNIYASTYACLLLSLYGELDKLSEQEKKKWVTYFDSFQEKDGFFYDKMIQNDLYDNTDWWGKRHLIPHIVMAYSALGARPRYQFSWLREYYQSEKIDGLIDSVDWNSAIMDDTDIDNKIMNIGVCLQYHRDYWNDKGADDAITYLKKRLIEHINPSTGFWGNYDLSNAAEHARMIQFSYHLQRILFYDEYKFSQTERMIDLILDSQNAYGGFSSSLNSSACADIDAIDPLVYFASQTNYRKDEINVALKRALVFILANQNIDGGFVFMRDSSFCYGSKEMSSMCNESAMFPTWFRTLSIAYVCKYLGIGKFNFIRCPGY